MIREAWAKIPTGARIAVILSAILLMALIGTSAYSDWQSGRAEAAEREAASEKAIAARLAQYAAAADRRASEAEAQARVLADKVAILKAKLASVPDPVEVPAPDDPRLHAELQAAGLRDPPVYRPDAVQIWQWRQDALAMPTWMEKYKICAEVAKAQEDQIKTQEVVILENKKSSDMWQRSANASEQRAEALQGAVTALNKEIKSQKVSKWLMVGGALAAGYVAGHRK